MRFTPFASWAGFSALAVCCFVSMAGAQEKAVPPPAANKEKPNAEPGAKPGGDPFVKKKGAAPAIEAAAADATPPDLLMTHEVFGLKQEEYRLLMETGADSAELYALVDKLKAAGKASLENVMAVTTRSGQRASIEQSDEVLYPSQWNPPQTADSLACPTAFEMRPAGQRLEIDPVAAEGRLVNFSISAPATKLLGFLEISADPAQHGLVQPKFEKRECITAATAWPDRPQFLGTQSHAAGADAEDAAMVHMVFVRMHPVAAREAAKAPAPGKGETTNLRLTAVVYSMERDAADALLKAAGDAEVLHAAVLEQTRKQGAKVERVLTCATKSGQRTVTREVEEFRFGTEINPPQLEVKAAEKMGENPGLLTGKTIPAVWTALDTRPLGWVMEVDPVLEENGRRAVDVSIDLQFTRYLGSLAGQDIVERRDPPRPVFEQHRMTTAVSITPGRHAFLGTLSPPQDTNVNGRKGDGRVWMAFALVTLD